MNKISIKLRVTLWYTLIMTAVSAAALLAMLSVSRDIIERDLKSKITKTVTQMSHRAVGPNGRMMPVHSSDFYEQGVYMAVYDSDKNLIKGMIPFDSDTDDDIIQTFSNDELKKVTINGNIYFIYDKEIKNKFGRSMWVRGFVSLTDESQILKSVAKTNIFLAVILIIAASAGGYLILKRAFKPVDKISRTAKEISESGDLSQRIAIKNGNDEIYRLAGTFDEMLDKIEQTLEREKQFTSDASHELRTPVAVITSECEYMLDCAKNEDEFKESANAVKRQADKMSKLISELLTISRMDKNTVQVNFENVDISELLSFVCDEQEEIHKNGTALIRQINQNVYAKADRFLLTRLFINLISNAYQYGKENGRVVVSLNDDSENVIFSVEDDGIGISDENLPKIWERFFQADPSRTNNENGSMGLGLSMVKWIAECHGGKITVESKLGIGSKFTLTLPKKI